MRIDAHVRSEVVTGALKCSLGGIVGCHWGSGESMLIDSWGVIWVNKKYIGTEQALAETEPGLTAALSHWNCARTEPAVARHLRSGGGISRHSLEACLQRREPSRHRASRGPGWSRAVSILTGSKPEGKYVLYP